MKAVTWHGIGDMRVGTHPDPEIQEPTDIIIKVTSTAICGSDLHLYDGVMPGMKEGDIVGHEPMGEVVEVGKGVSNLKKGDRVVVPFTISCGHCWFCDHELFSLCDTTNPNAEMVSAIMGHSPAALFGYSHLMGGIPGGRRNISACRRATSGRSRFPMASPTSRFSSSPTSSRRGGWGPRTPRSSPATRSRYGAAGRSANSRSRAHG